MSDTATSQTVTQAVHRLLTIPIKDVPPEQVARDLRDADGRIVLAATTPDSAPVVVGPHPDHATVTVVQYDMLPSGGDRHEHPRQARQALDDITARAPLQAIAYQDLADPYRTRTPDPGRWTA